MVATLSDIVPASRCPIDTREHPTAPLSYEEAPTTADVRWRGAFRAPRAELRDLAQNCVAAAFFRFARVPYWALSQEGSVLGDLRYDRNPGLDFADIPIAARPHAEAKCPAAVPPWTPPRLDVLGIGPP
jgi:inner membrane protein